MAKENFVQMIGIVQTIPKYNEARDRTAYEIQTVRSGKRRDNLYVQAYGEAAKIAKDFNPGDLVIANGVVAVNDVKRSTYCPTCNERIIRETSVTEVVAISNLRIYKSGDNFNLDDFKDISNVIKIMGTVLRKPKYSNTKKGPIAKYPIAINRRFIIEGQTRKTDEPFIASYGAQAEEAYENLRTDSLVYINGAMQARDVSTTRECPHCKAKYIEQSFVREIIPYNIEYLANCEQGVKERPKKEKKANKDSEENS